MSALSEERVKEVLGTVQDPCINQDIVKYRLVKKIEVSGADVLVTIAIPTPVYPQAQRIELRKRIETALRQAGAATVTVMLEVDTAFQPAPSEKALLPGVKNVIAVAAGKGGVGKSTVATNLALAFQELGARVGLLDADIFGPSIPKMLGPATQPAATTQDQKIIPAIHHGLKVVSIGFFTDPNEAVVWRGPMVHRLLQQFLGDVMWGDLDYLICDLPPGTGDVQLSLSQLIPISGAVMVTTPQEVALIDVIKGIAMFKKVEIPILGIVENMSYYQCQSCGHTDEIFARGGGKRLADEIDAELLGEIPIDTRIRFGGDTGVPIVASAPDSAHAQRFRDIATRVGLMVAERVLAKPKRSSRLAVIK
jgi:ATP-binding protein involved in chromosome partitioning